MTEHALIRWFENPNLRPELRHVAAIFASAAKEIDLILPSGAEKTVAMRKLLEGKDAAVRAMVEALEAEQPN